MLKVMQLEIETKLKPKSAQMLFFPNDRAKISAFHHQRGKGKKRDLFPK